MNRPTGKNRGYLMENSTFIQSILPRETTSEALYYGASTTYPNDLFSLAGFIKPNKRDRA